MRILLSGPMRGKPNFGFDELDRMADELRGMGHEVINPADEFRRTGFDPANPREFDKESVSMSIAQRIMDLGNCDAICLIDDWSDSYGARAEYAAAVACGIPEFGLETSIEYAEEA